MLGTNCWSLSNNTCHVLSLRHLISNKYISFFLQVLFLLVHRYQPSCDLSVVVITFGNKWLEAEVKLPEFIEKSTRFGLDKIQAHSFL